MADPNKEPDGTGRSRKAEAKGGGERKLVRILPFRGVLRETSHRAYRNGPGSGFEAVTWIAVDQGLRLRPGPNVTLAPN